MPTIVEWGEISLDGKMYVIDPASGPFRGIHRQESAILDPPITFGDTTYKSHPYLSSWVISDLTGGIGVEDITGADTNRYRWGTADARSPGNIALGPLITQTRPTTDDTDVLYGAGDVPGTNEEFYVAVEESAGLCNLYAWNETTDAWRAASLDIDSRPLKEPVRFKGTNADEYLVFARDTNDLMGVRTTAAGTLASVTGLVDARRVAVWDNRLWAMTKSAQNVHFSFNITSWTAVTDPTTGATLALDPAQPIEWMLSWWNLAAESTLYFMTHYSLWALNLLEEKLEHIYNVPRYKPLYDAAETASNLTQRPLAVWPPTEDLWIGVGGTIIRRTPSGVTVKQAGPGADADGVPAEFVGAFIDLEPELDGLYGITSGFKDVSKAALLVYNGTGWFPLWEAPNDDYLPTRILLSNASGAYRLWWGHGSYAYTMEPPQIPRSSRQKFILGVDKFAASSYFETGRFWAQTWGQNKLAVLVDVYMENATATETLTVQYQTDTVTSWTTLGSAIVTGRNNGTYRTTTRFGTANADGVNPGIAFNWIKFRFNLARGSTNTLTPILNALVLHFLKIRDNTPAFQISLVFPDLMPDGRTGDQAKADLVTLVEANALVTLRYGENIHGVWVAGLSGPDSSGSDNRGARTLSLISIQEI